MSTRSSDSQSTLVSTQGSESYDDESVAFLAEPPQPTPAPLSTHHLHLYHLPEIERVCLICSSLPRTPPGSGLDRDMSARVEMDLQVVQLVADEMARDSDVWVTLHIIPSNPCVTGDPSCTTVTHQRDNLLVLCTVHARLYNSDDKSKASMLFSLEFAEIRALREEEKRVHARYTEYEKRLQAENRWCREDNIFEWPSMGQSSFHDGQRSPTTYTCFITSPNAPLVAVKVNLCVPPIFPLKHFSKTAWEMPISDWVNPRPGAYPRALTDAMSKRVFECLRLFIDLSQRDSYIRFGEYERQILWGRDVREPQRQRGLIGDEPRRQGDMVCDEPRRPVRLIGRFKAAWRAWKRG